MEQLYTPEEVAKILAISMTTMYRFMKENKIKTIKVGSQYRIKESELNDFLSEVA